MEESESAQIESGNRFAFGANWNAFLKVLNEQRIESAVRGLQRILCGESLSGAAFLDIGSGSGLSSLAAVRLGARVVSFDFDSLSVSCTKEVKQRFAPQSSWEILQGDVLDTAFLERLGLFDVVYSWGVLHHTGDLWSALRHAAGRVRPGGRIAVAIYNDDGIHSKRWRSIKKLYCSGLPGRMAVQSVFIPYFFLENVLGSIYRGENVFAEHKRERGMSPIYDWLDWLGGYPFEVAKVEEVFHFLRPLGFKLENLITRRGKGNNEFLFIRATQ